MLALSRAERRAVSAAALCAFLAAFASVPGLAGSRSAPPHVMATLLESALPEPSEIVPARDPFTPRIDETEAAPLPAVSAGLAPLPANAGAGPFPFALTTPAPARLLAVVSGPQPGAIVVEHGSTRFVTLHDRIGGVRITAIDAGGIVLENGHRFDLTHTEPEALR